jgi:hypothetical protein
MQAARVSQPECRELDKRKVVSEIRTSDHRLKPEKDRIDLRGPEGPLFHVVSGDGVW